MSHCDHRLWLELNGPELHVYNRSQLYARLEKVFGLESQLGTGKGGREDDDEGEEEPQRQPGQSRDMSFWQDWRDLIPVIKIELNMVRSSVIACITLVFPLVDERSVLSSLKDEAQHGKFLYITYFICFTGYNIICFLVSLSSHEDQLYFACCHCSCLLGC